MNLIGTATEKLERCNHRLLGVILRFVLPRYGKKLMLLVGVFSGLRHLKAITPDELERLNATLGLASCPEALEFPAMVSKRIWKGIELEGVDLNTASESTYDKLVANIPQWLRYDTNEVMVDDIRGVVNHTRLQAA